LFTDHKSVPVAHATLNAKPVQTLAVTALHVTQYHCMCIYSTRTVSNPVQIFIMKMSPLVHYAAHWIWTVIIVSTRLIVKSVI